MIADISKGESRQAGEGIVRLAKISGRPIVPVALATSRRNVLERTWDKTTINLPFGTPLRQAGTADLRCTSMPVSSSWQPPVPKGDMRSSTGSRKRRSGPSGRCGMSRGWARAALVGYRWFGAGIYPLLGPYLAIRAAKGKEDAVPPQGALWPLADSPPGRAAGLVSCCKCRRNECSYAFDQGSAPDATSPWC
jgi:hypothetical protein